VDVKELLVSSKKEMGMELLNKTIINRFIMVAIVLIVTNLSTFAQREPDTNIGKTFSEMKTIFPKLRFIEHTPNGDNYQNGDTENGVSAFFTINDGRVIGECVMVRSKNGAAKAWFDKVKSDMLALSSAVFKETDVHQLYSTFSCHLYFSKESDEYCSALYYYEGGWKDGIVGKDFYEIYKK